VHTVLGYLEPYALCNVVDFDDLAMIAPRYEIDPLESTKSRADIEKYIQITDIGMGSYKIEGVNLFTSVKDLG